MIAAWATFLLVALLAAPSSSSSSAAAFRNGRPPNIVIILADDMGWGDWSRTGSQADTPHLDEMSRSSGSVWFQRAYSGNPICSPTRASILTGRTPTRTCIYSVEQHALCHQGICKGGEYSVANATRDHGGYLSGFFGKWHLGSLRNETEDCYTLVSASDGCLPGYVNFGSKCCQGTDGKLPISQPLQFGFDRFVATPQCAPSATTNCGCFFSGSEKPNATCQVGHYESACPTCGEHLECGQYFKGDASSNEILALDYVSDEDDEGFLTGQFEELLIDSQIQNKSFLAFIHFHGVHIPYVATEKVRGAYMARGFTANEADYYGTISQIDAAVGRIRSLLREHGIENSTYVSITADNGPEVSPANGQGTGKP